MLLQKPCTQYKKIIPAMNWDLLMPSWIASAIFTNPIYAKGLLEKSKGILIIFLPLLLSIFVEN